MTDISVGVSPEIDSVATQIRNSVGIASEAEMAAILQVSEETLATWRCKKRGPPSIKLGKKVFYLIADFGKWVLGEVEKQSAASSSIVKRPRSPHTRPSNANEFRRQQKLLEEARPAVHVDENQPGVHVQY